MYELNSETGEILLKRHIHQTLRLKSLQLHNQGVDADGNEITQDISIPVEDIEPEGSTIELAEIVPTPENTEIPAGTAITSIVNFERAVNIH